MRITKVLPSLPATYLKIAKARGSLKDVPQLDFDGGVRQGGTWRMATEQLQDDFEGKDTPAWVLANNIFSLIFIISWTAGISIILFIWKTIIFWLYFGLTFR